MDQQNSQRINLNTAKVRDLRELPGMDRSLARRIVFERKLHGAFRSLEDLARVEGLDPKLIEHVSGLIEVEETEFAVAPSRVKFDCDRSKAEEKPPFAFWGTPQSVLGTVQLRNEGGSTQNQVSLRLESGELKALHGKQLQLTSTIAPGQAATVPVALQLDPNTPPGVYKTELIAGEDRCPAVIYIVERIAVSVAPTRFMISNVPSAKTDRRFVIHNDGNVPITIEDLGAAPIEDRNVRCRTIRETLRKVDHPTWDEFVGTAADEFKKTFAQIDPIRIRNKNKPVTIEPGETTAIELEIQNPKNARRGRHYIAHLPFYNMMLTFELLPGWAEEETPA
jgi:Helix-hairpin-helix motif